MFLAAEKRGHVFQSDSIEKVNSYGKICNVHHLTRTFGYFLQKLESLFKFSWTSKKQETFMNICSKIDCERKSCFFLFLPFCQFFLSSGFTTTKN